MCMCIYIYMYIHIHIYGSEAGRTTGQTVAAATSESPVLQPAESWVCKFMLKLFYNW